MEARGVCAGPTKERDLIKLRSQRLPTYVPAHPVPRAAPGPAAEAGARSAVSDLAERVCGISETG